MKRRLITLLIFLLLGTIVNVAVAWGCAFKSEPDSAMLLSAVVEHRAHSMRPHDENWICARGWSSSTMVDEQEWQFSLHPDLIRAGFGLRSQTVTEVGSTFTAGNKWPWSREIAQFTDAGWPAPALTSRAWNAGPRFLERADHWITDDGIVCQPSQQSLIYQRYLPLRPLWPGFAINTLFYAAILWLLFALPGALRRRRRIKRGLCPACAYPVGTSEVCTECGGPLEVQR